VTCVAVRVWSGLRLMMLPFAWLAWFPAIAIICAGTGLTLCAVMDSDGWVIDLTYAFAAFSAAAAIFNIRRKIIGRRWKLGHG
jgi:hypothetical protein